MENNFGSPYEYKLIYIFKIKSETHKGLLKIGDTTLSTTESIDKLYPNCKILNQAALNRIKQYTNTAGITPELVHTELAIRTILDKNENINLETFRDYHVHNVLVNSGIKKKKIINSTSKEWFEINLDIALKAINAVKNNHYNLSNTLSSYHTPVIFRPEQEDAIEKTIKQFKSRNSMLWNAKMRFGKTLSALEVVRRCGYKKTLIITHRPVVDSGWYEDFGKIFKNNDGYIYGSKNTGYTLDEIIKLDKKIVYFSSIQDLRGSDFVGGKYDKNSTIFKMNWDFVIVDEAHEGTTTTLGNDVINNIVKEGSGFDTKLLELSGTPFNILNKYDENIYTWDYVMEQQSKFEWDKKYFGDSNPYDELPELKIYTYDLGKILKNNIYEELEDKAFNFKEFFRVCGVSESDLGVLHKKANKQGAFIHENDVLSFLNLITRQDGFSQYPYSSEEFRDLFKHSLWMVPGVKEAKALSSLMKKHPVFGNGAFTIVNVAGDGDEEEKYEDALEKVRDAINLAGEDGYTITLSCGKLTTGVTVPEWTAVFMLAGSSSTSAATYLQTIFRVQSPFKTNGKYKRSCFVFDFAPDRTLKMVAEAVSLSSKAGKQSDSDKIALGEFLNYCPVIAVEGSVMKKYDTNLLLQELKKAYADRVVKNGFDDNNLYNDSLLRLDKIEVDKFNNLKKIVGSSKSALKSNEIEINNQGFDDEEYEKLENINNKSKREITPEEEEWLKKIAEKKKQRANAISILRAISIRIPLLIYGADIDIDEEITMEKLVEIVDDSSWVEFMPKNVTKDLFRSFIKFYDQDVFIAAGKKIRNSVHSADNLSPLERIYKVVEIFSYFKNPDKETVLTPWRVVNMHLSDSLGGYCFYDEQHNYILESPRFVDRGRITLETVLNKNAKILEFNSKTGLYPLYVAASIYLSRCSEFSERELDLNLQEKLWKDTLKNNIYVICKTPMAKAITRRTLTGYIDRPINSHYFDNLVNMMKNKSKQFVERILKPSYWKTEGDTIMKFDAIVGNPPYQQMDGGNGVSASPLYSYFVEHSIMLNPKYISMIMPARWYIGGKGLDNFRSNMINDKHISLLVDYPNSNDVFPSVDIAGGICYFRWEKDYSGKCEVKNIVDGHECSSQRYLNEFEVFIRDNRAIDIVNKIKSLTKNTLESVVSSRKPFGLPTNYVQKEIGVPCWFIQKIGLQYANENDIEDKFGYINKWKFLVPKSPIAGQTNFSKPVGFYYDGNTIIAKPGEVCTESFIVAGAFDTKDETLSFKSYLFTKVVRFLLLQGVISQDVTKKNFCFVPDLGKYEGYFTDEILKSMWNISDEEWRYIDSRIKSI